MKLRGLYVLNPAAHDAVYGPRERDRIARHVDLAASGPLTGGELAARPGRLRGVDVILSGWGGPRLDAALLARADRLRAVFYGAGSIKGVMTDAAWDRGIAVTTAAAANAVPVAEFTVAQIVMGLKRVWQSAAAMRRDRAFRRPTDPPGCYGSTVALLSLGLIGRMVAGRLRDGFDLRVIAYDPFAPADVAAELGVELVGLDEAFASADLVSVHTPWLPETEGMIRGGHVRSMRPGATLLNTARGAVIDERELAEALRDRPDLLAILDVTHPEPPPPRSPLWDLENVILTPHTAGSLGRECRRMGAVMAAEVERFARGEPLAWGVTREQFLRSA